CLPIAIVKRPPLKPFWHGRTRSPAKAERAPNLESTQRAPAFSRRFWLARFAGAYPSGCAVCGRNRSGTWLLRLRTALNIVRPGLLNLGTGIALKGGEH